MAVDIGNEAANIGLNVQLLFLAPSGIERDDITRFKVRQFRFSDIYRLRGTLHTHCLRPDIIGGMTAVVGKCRTVTTLHNYFRIDLGFDHARWKVSLSWLIWKWAIQKMNHVACISRSMLRYYARETPSARLSLAYNFRAPAVANNAAMPQGSIDWFASQRRDGQTVLAFVGGLNPRKRVVQLFNALLSAPDLSLVCCGEGVERPQLDAMMEQNPSLARRVHMVGQTRTPSIYIEAADMLVLPSLAEGLPLVVLEAARAGRPSLLSNIAVHRELERLGLGKTFDRKSFTNFATQARAIRGEAGSEMEQHLKQIWRAHFSPEAGFKAYREMLLSVG